MALAEATVRVTLEVTRFEEDLRKQVQQAADRAGKDADKSLTKSFGDAGKNAAQSFKDSAKPGMQDAGSEALKDFEKGLEGDAAATGTRVGDKVTVGLKSRMSEAGLESGKAFADNVGQVLESSGKDVGHRMSTSLGNALEEGASKIGTDIADLIGKNASTSSSSNGSKSGAAFASGFKSSFIANNPLIAAGVALGSAFSEQLLQSSGIVAAIPALLGAVTATALVTVSAFKGIGDAIKAVGSGDITKLSAAMDKLSPQAQGFVRDFAAVRPVLAGVRSDIQDAFFGQLQGQVKDAAGALSGPLRAGLTGVAEATGVVARQFAGAFTELRGIDNVNKLLSGTKEFLLQLSPGIQSVARGFLDFTGATSPALLTLGNSLSGLLTKFGNFLATSANSGKALDWVSGGIVGLRNLTHGLGDLLQSLITLSTALRPVAFGFSGLLGIAENLVSLFGKLPAPIQTAALAVALFIKSGLPKFLKDAADKTGPVSKAIGEMGQAYQLASTKAASLGIATTAATTVTSGLSRAVDGVSTAAGIFGNTIRSGINASLDSLEAALGRTNVALQTGVIQGTLAADSALTRMSASSTTAAQNFDSGLIPAALRIDQAVTRAGIALSNFGENVRDKVIRATTDSGQAISDLNTSLQTGFIRATNAAGTAASTFSAGTQTAFIRASNAANSALDSIGSSLQSGLVRATGAASAALGAASSAASSFSTTIQTGVIRAAISANTALDNVGATLRGGVLSGLFSATAAYRSSSTAVRDYATAQTNLHSTLEKTPTLLGAARSAFTSLSAVTAGTGAAVASAFSGPLAAAGGAVDAFAGRAAGLGSALKSGLGSAVSGLMGVLGGPWGVVVAGAGVVLSLLTQKQEESAAAAAKHEAAVATLATTLDHETGAVTAATRASVADTAAKDGSTTAANNLGISTIGFVNALLGQAPAMESVQARLKNLTATQIENSSEYKTGKDAAAKYGITLDLLSSAASGNADAGRALATANAKSGNSFNDLISVSNFLTDDQKKLLKSLKDTKGSLDDAAKAAKEAADAMTPAQLVAQHYSDALGILADKTSDADAKTHALVDALNILAGGTIPAEVAQAHFTDLLKQMNDQLDANTKGLTGSGKELINQAGRINTTSQAGAFLVDQFKSLNDTLSASAVATVQAGKENGNLDAALVQVAGQAQAARDQFIKTAEQLGINATDAAKLADQYGLIPAQVLTTVTDQGSAQNVQLQVAGVDQRLKDLPPNTDVRVSGLTDDAIKKLRDTGVAVTAIPGSKDVTVNAKTQGAVDSLNSLVKSFAGTVINFVANVIGGKAAGDIVGNARGNIIGYASGGTHKLTPMPANRAEIVAANTWRVIGDRANDPEAYIPINSSARSRSLLAETARRMGFTLMADGGLTGTSPAAGRVLNVAAGAIVVNAPFADPQLVARATLNEVAREAVA